MTIKDLFLSLVFLFAYFISGKLGLSLAFLHQSASPVWPPTGLAIAIFLLWGVRYWPCIFVGAFLVNVTTLGTYFTSFSIAVGNTLEAVLVATFLDRYAKGVRVFSHPKDIFKFALIAGFSTTISATFGVTTLVLGSLASWTNYGSIWLTWWLGDFVGAVVVCPVIVLLSSKRQTELSDRQIIEGIGFLGTLVVVSMVVFNGLTFLGRGNYPIAFLCMPPLLWGAFRFGTRATAIGMFVLSALAIWGTINGFGPFARESPNESLLIVQGFVGITGIVMMAVAAVVQERRSTEQGLHDLTSQLNERIKLGADVLLQKEKELVRTTAEREQLDLFASLASHDLQEPLRKITVFADLLKAECSQEISGAGKNYIERLQNAVKRMSDLIRDLHHFSKVGAEFELPGHVDLNKTLKELIFDLELPIKEANAEITVDKLPTISAGPVQLRELFHNLIMNSLKFRKKGQPVHIQISAETMEQDIVKIIVKDDGIGFENEYAKRIFKPFERLHGQAEYPGTGVGLAICQRIVERLGGKISAESSVGEGATFVIVLPNKSLLYGEGSLANLNQ